MSNFGKTIAITSTLALGTMLTGFGFVAFLVWFYTTFPWAGYATGAIAAFSVVFGWLFVGFYKPVKEQINARYPDNA